MTAWTGPIPNAGQLRSVGMGGGDLSGVRGVPFGGAGSADGDGSWVGDVAVALLEGLLGGREGAASHATSQSFPRPATGTESDCCSCSCFADLAVGSVRSRPGPSHAGSSAGGTGLPTAGASRPVLPLAAPDARPTFEAEVRGQAPREIDLELAAMAQDVYDLDSQGIEGWARLDEQQLAAANIDPEMLEDPETGFRAAIYTDGEGRYVLAFAGTDAAEIPDWLANFGQGLGFDAEQYAQAELLATRAEQAFGDDLVMTGHSLGGGLAAMSALATDSAAVTFNAAGLHDNTIRELDMSPDAARTTAEDGLIRNYVVDGEALTYVQEESPRLAPFAPDAVGHEIELADPHSFWEHLNPLNLWEPSHRVRLHLMDAVLDALQQDRPWERAASAA